MGDSFFSGDTLDDLMRPVIEEIRRRGRPVRTTKGNTTELMGVLLELKEPHARLSRSETRGHVFSCLGELCWYMAKTNRLDFIQYYLPRYNEFADGEIIFGGYGPRLFDWNGIDQIASVTALLRRKPSTRQAVMQLFAAGDIVEEHKDVPCTCTLQFVIRDDRLELVTSMRSNDAYSGLVHDVFCFTMLQEIMARSLGIEPGVYKHAVGSIHIYDTDQEPITEFLAEGWQPTASVMPPMPSGDPWPAIHRLSSAEAIIRTQNAFGVGDLTDLDPYWADLIRLLQVFRCLIKDRDPDKAKRVRETMSSNTYHAFIDRKLAQFNDKQSTE